MRIPQDGESVDGSSTQTEERPRGKQNFLHYVFQNVPLRTVMAIFAAILIVELTIEDAVIAVIDLPEVTDTLVNALVLALVLFPLLYYGVYRQMRGTALELSEATTALHESNQLLESLLNNTHSLIAYLDPQFTMIRVNQAYAEFDGLEPAYFEGKYHFGLYPNKETEAVFRKVVESGESVFVRAQPFQYTEGPHLGTIYWDWSLVPIKDGMGQVSGLVLTVENVTEHVKAREALQQSHENLERRVAERTSLLTESNEALKHEIAERERAQQREQRFAHLLDGATNEIYVLDGNTFKFIQVNKGACDNLGYTQEEMKELTPASIVPDYSLQELRELMEPLRSGEQNILRLVSRHQRKDGTEYPVEVNIEAAHWGEEEVFLALVLDISARQQAEQQQLELALERERVTLLEELISDISHDLKTPISIIKTNIYLLERVRNDPEKLSRKLRILQGATERLELLIGELMTMSRLDKVVTLKLKRLKVNAMVEDIYERLNSLGEEKNLSMSMELEPDLPAILADEGELYRAAVNIVQNAIHYTPDGGTISLKTYARDEGVILEISDTGIGIQEADLPFVFDRFFRADKSRPADKGGSGLGLSIARKIIELHDGTIELESVPDRGTTFRIFLPGMRIQA